MAELGLGKDIWTLPFENITAILKVRHRTRSHVDSLTVGTGLLCRRRSISDRSARHQDFHLLDLSPHFRFTTVSDDRVWSHWPERMLWHCFCLGIRLPVLAHPVRLDALAW